MQSDTPAPLHDGSATTSTASRIILALAVAEAVALGVIYWMWLV